MAVRVAGIIFRPDFRHGFLRSPQSTFGAFAARSRSFGALIVSAKLRPYSRSRRAPGPALPESGGSYIWSASARRLQLEV